MIRFDAVQGLNCGLLDLSEFRFDELLMVSLGFIFLDHTALTCCVV